MLRGGLPKLFCVVSGEIIIIMNDELRSLSNRYRSIYHANDTTASTKETIKSILTVQRLELLIAAMLQEEEDQD